MKKVLLMFALIATLLVGSMGTAGAQVSYTVYDGTNTSSNVPVYGLYTDAYLKCEYVIPADHLTAINGSTISKLTYYLQTSATAGWTSNFQVFLKEVASSSISDYSGTTDATIVYEGTLNATGSTMEIQFSTPYTYNGGNLLIGIYNVVKGNYKSATFYGQSVTGSCVQGYDYNDLSNITATQKDFIPKTTFTVNQLSGCVTPTNLEVTNVTPTGATVTWTPGNTESSWIVKFNDLEFNTNTPSYTTTALTPNTTYVASVKAVCSATEESEFTMGSAFTTLPSCPAPTGLTVSEITTTGATLAWTAGYEETEWTISINGTEVGGIVANPYTLTGLNPATSYTVMVKANCSTIDESGWSTAASFVTECETNTTFPYVVDFESTVFPPTCWSQIRLAGTSSSTNYANGAWTRYTGTNGTNSTAQAQLRDDRAGNLHQLFTGAQNFTYAGGYTLSVDVYRNTSSYATEGIRIYVNSTPTVDENATELAFISRNYTVASTVNADIVGAETTSGWYTYELPITATGVNYIIFQGESQYGSSTYMDNVIISEVPTCPKPNDVVISNITTNSAEIAWTNGGTETAWTIDVNGTEVSANTNPFTLTGLDAATEYTIMVKANCSADDESVWSNAASFVTECETNTTFPYVVDFESTVFPPICWSQSRTAVGTGSSGTDYPNGAWTRSTSTTGSNTTAKAQLRDTRAGSIHPLVTGAQNFTYAGGYMLSVDVYRVASGSTATTEGIRIYVNSTPAVDENATELAFISRNYTVASTVNADIVGAETASGWYTYELPITATGVNYVIFQGESQYSSSTYMDNVIISEIPTCPRPTSVVVSNITENTADIAWTNGGEETAWTISYNGTEVAANTNPFTLTGLDASTLYTVMVKANCSADDESAYSVETSFRTECGAVNAPFFESFEEGDFGCWSTESDDATHIWSVSSSVPSSGYTNLSIYDGQYIAVMNCNTFDSVTAKLISPVLNLAGLTAPELSFQYVNRDWGGDQNVLTVYYRTAADAEWTSLATYNSSVSTWTEEIIALPNVTATYQIAFEGTSYYGYNIALDAISVYGVSCPAPTDVDVAYETENSAEISWYPGGEETAWNIRYRAIPDVAFYDFEDGMQGWTAVDLDGDGYNWMLEDCSETPHNTPYEGNGCLYSASYSGSALTPDNWVISPEVELTGVVKFMAKGQDASWAAEHFAVYAIEGEVPATFTADDFTAVGQEQIATGEYVEYTFDLSNFNGMGHVAIRHFNVTDQFVLVVDNISIGEEPGEWTVVNGVTNPYTLTGLDANTTYEVQVQAACSEEDASNWTAGVEFTTLEEPVVEPCDVPTNVAVENNVATWESEAENFNVMYVVNGDTTVVAVAANTYTFEGLEDGALVAVMVQAICDSTNLSEWSEAVEFNYEGVGINNYSINANVYPNPTTGNVYVECAAINANVTVFDMFGKVIMTSTIANERTELNFNNVAPGVYMIRIATNNESTTVKVVKE